MFRKILTLAIVSFWPMISNALPIPLMIVDNRFAIQPAINDHGEIIYVLDHSIVSTRRGLLVSSASAVDASNIGLSNSGEVVWSNGSSASVVNSTTRGILVDSRSYGPTIASTTGEVAYVNIDGASVSNVSTTLQGSVESFDESLGLRTGVADVNDSGEVVFELRDLSSPFTRIYSTNRGFLTPANTDATQPAIIENYLTS